VGASPDAIDLLRHSYPQFVFVLLSHQGSRQPHHGSGRRSRSLSLTPTGPTPPPLLRTQRPMEASPRRRRRVPMVEAVPRPTARAEIEGLHTAKLALEAKAEELVRSGTVKPVRP
jgi:hypothetical protein